MTEKIKTALNTKGWEILMTALLTVILMSMGWYINRITNIQDQQQMMMDRCHEDQQNMARILYMDPDTSPDEKEELRPIFIVTRGAKANLKQ